MGIVSKSQSGRACAEPASGPSAPRSGGGAKRRALTPVSTRARCWLDDAAGDHNILRSTGVQFPSEPRARQHTASSGVPGEFTVWFSLGVHARCLALDDPAPSVANGTRRRLVESAKRYSSLSSGGFPAAICALPRPPEIAACPSCLPTHGRSLRGWPGTDDVDRGRAAGQRPAAQAADRRKRTRWSQWP